MQHIARLSFTLILAFTLSGTIWAKTTLPQAEYKRSDTNFYLKSDVLKVDPSAVILPASQVTKKGDFYFMTPEKKAPKEIYLQVSNDWIEPITPPNMPASLGVPSNDMQIRELRGDVQVALPSAPANFVPAHEDMTIPNGTVVKTGANGTVAVLFGGVDSARLIPNSEAAVQQTVTAQSRSTEVDLTVGAVFSKVGQRIGEKEDYKVHTPFGVAAARGTDFVSVVMPSRTDVWVAQGTVQLNQPNGKMVGEVKSDGAGALKIIRFPVMTDPHQTMMADAETMTDAMNIIPMVDLKTKALHVKMANDIELSATEKDYLSRIEKVPCLIKLALVEPVVATKPTSATYTGSVAPATPTTPVAAAPATPAPATPAASHHHVKLAPIDLTLRADGKIDFQGATLSLDELTPKLTELAKATPVHPILIKGQENVTPDQLKKVVDACHAAKLKKVTVFKAKSGKSKSGSTKPASTPPVAAAPAPSASPTPPPAKRPPPTMQLPMNKPAPGASTATASTSNTTPGKSNAPQLATTNFPAATGPNDTVP